MHGEDIWDEEQWEAYLAKNDAYVNQCVSILSAFLVDNPVPDKSDTAAVARWTFLLREHLIERGISYEEGFFSSLSSELPDLSVGDLALRLSGADFAVDDDEEESIFDRDSTSSASLYPQAYAFSARVLDWTHSLPGEVKDSLLVQFCTYVLQIPANTARGDALGYEHDTIGGNIAFLKRALDSANSGLHILLEMKDEPYMTEKKYRGLVEDLYELRNTLGVYIQDLRERFALGLD